MTMERKRRTGWTGGPRPQHASARKFPGYLRVAVDRLDSPDRSAFSAAFRAFLIGTRSQTEFAVTRSKQSTGTFLTGARIASLAHSKSSDIHSKLSEGCAWLRL